MQTIELSDDEVDILLAQQEGHFFDVKSKRIDPAKLTRTISALANADGGEVCVGIEDPQTGGSRWDGFEKEEDANAHLNVLENQFPTSEAFSYRFLKSNSLPGLILSCEVFKNQQVWTDSKGDVYLRKGAQNIKQASADKVERLRLNKGITSYEDQKLELSANELTESSVFKQFIAGVVPKADPLIWLQKQKLTRDGNATVAAAVCMKTSRK